MAQEEEHFETSLQGTFTQPSIERVVNFGQYQLLDNIY